MTIPRIVACPQCGTPVTWVAEARFRPFCSERCKMVDLGAWAAESYRVATGASPADADEAEPTDEA